MKTTVLFLLTGLAVQPAAAQQLFAADCIHLNYPGHFMQVDADTAVNLTKIYGPVVPHDEVWMIEQAGLSAGIDAPPNQGTTFKFEIIEPLPDQFPGVIDASGSDLHINDCCWRIALPTDQFGASTPFAALSHSVLLKPGERLAGRTGQNDYPFKMTVLVTRYPSLCMAALQWGR